MQKKYIENRIRIDPEVNLCLDDYILEKGVAGDQPGLRAARNTFVTDVVKAALEELGYYPRRNK